MNKPTLKADCRLQILQIVQETPDVRQDKVKKLKEQIESSSYKMDADRIAERMLEESLMDALHLHRRNRH
jgi:flagellar biosynthesis anti-sigma factor FlgM